MKKILIIDDDPVVATVYQRMLEREGFATEVASDGAQGLDRALSFEPDAVKPLADLIEREVLGKTGFAGVTKNSNFEIPSVSQLPVG